MYLITSGEYINQGLDSEFGKIPHAFLPLQNKRLFNHHIDKIATSEEIYISIPESFNINEKDKLDLDEKKVNIVKIPTGLSLGHSIVHALNSIGKYNLEIKIIHGDTLFDNLDFPVNVYVVSMTNDNYKWAFSGSDSQENIVYAGFFSFSDQKMLIKSLINHGYDFIKALKSYKKHIKVSEYYTDKWYDFGHINTFYRSKSNLTTERVFNKIKINNQTVYKSSSNKAKILAEANWFNSIPVSLKIYSPQIYNYGEKNGEGFYETEYLFLSTLSELFVFGLNQPFIWAKILESCQKFINTCYTFKPQAYDDFGSINDFYATKTYSRLKEFEKMTDFKITNPIIVNNEKFPSLIEVAEITSKLINPVEINDVCLIHGDFCFSNILYDFRTQNIKVIDPRGVDIQNKQNIYGDIRYDVAKLAHSVLGLYDLIMADFYRLEEVEPYNYIFTTYTNSVTNEIQKQFEKMKFGGRTLDELEIYPILVHLFLSMLPLHSENFDRQKALLTNALILFKKAIK